MGLGPLDSVRIKSGGKSKDYSKGRWTYKDSSPGGGKKKVWKAWK